MIQENEYCASSASPGELAMPSNRHTTMFSAMASVVLIALSLGLAQLFSGNWQPRTGDTVHYVVITHSLVYDHDVELTNQYRDLFEGQLFDEAHAWEGTLGEWYPGHDLGLPLFMAVPYRLGGARGVALALLAMTILLAVNTCKLAIAAAPDRWSIVATTMVLTTPPLFLYVMQLFPEALAALAICVAVRFTCQERLHSSVWASIAGFCTAYLPWLELRFVSVVFVLAIIVTITRDIPFRQKVIYYLAIGLGGFLLMCYKYALFGSPFAHEQWHSGNFGVVGILVDAQHGLLIYSPVFVACAAGLVLLWRANKRMAGVITFTAGAVFLPPALWFEWWGGAAPQPGRFVVPLIPLMAPGLAFLLSTLRTVGRGFIAVLWLASLVTSAYFLMDSKYVYSGQMLQAMSTFDRWKVLRLLPDIVDNSTSSAIVFPVSRWWDSAAVLGAGIIAIGVGLVRAASKHLQNPDKLPVVSSDEVIK